MALRKVDGGVYVTEAGQFIISFSRSGRRAFLVSDAEAERFMTVRDRLKMVLVLMLAVCFGGPALGLLSPIWILAPGIFVPLAGSWLRRRISETFPPLTNPEIIAEIADRNEGREPGWFFFLSVAVFGLMTWANRTPLTSRSADVVLGLVLILTIVQYAATKRAHAAHQSDRPSSAVTH